MGSVLSVNVGRLIPNPAKRIGVTGIDKRPVSGPVAVADPGPKGVGGSGLAGDAIADLRHHGGTDQAVYAYALEDLTFWSSSLDRSLAPGSFGENVTTSGISVTDAPVGSLWRIGTALLRVTEPRIPCGTFSRWLGERRWEKRFTAAARPGTYLSVVSPGVVQAGDEIVVEHLPAHDVTVGLVFRAITLEPDLLPHLLTAGEDLPWELRETLTHRLA